VPQPGGPGVAVPYHPAVTTSVRSGILGLSAGFIGGLFGVGGGLVLVPGLVLWLGVTQHRAHATSLAAIVVSASAGLTPFAFRGEVDWATGGVIAVGAIIGAYVGARTAHRIPAVWLARAFVVLVLVSAVRLGFFE
jgi:uncharacterized membrane protein YfcA